MTNGSDEFCVDVSRQVVTFDLAGETYCVNLDIVQEVIRPAGLTKAPGAPDFIDGVINLRGFVIPVVDLAARFGLGRVGERKSTRIMIVEIDDQLIGVKVDGVLEVKDIAPEEIEPPSNLLKSSVNSEYLIGFIELEDALVKVLDFEKIFSGAELRRLRKEEEATHSRKQVSEIYEDTPVR